MVSEPVYEFKVDLAVVESLGINLYSNAAAVLSELVANAWDADANTVSVAWNTSGNSIVIEDDGCGMTLAQLNDRYLRVAYKKREKEGTKSPKHGRPFMGRKGIGKLSVFSLAEHVIVYSARDGERNGLEISVEALRERISAEMPYYPKSVPVPDDLPDQGTRIILSKLNKRRTAVSVTALRRRVARRFFTLGMSDTDPARFNIEIDGRRVTFEDRQDLKRLEYIWELGSSEIADANVPKVKKRWLETDNVINSAEGWIIQGWFGTVSKPDELNDDEDPNESLKNIMILARRRPIQEGILDQLDFNKIFGNYVTGQIRAEFLDLDDGADDIATSDRQRLIEDDFRVTQFIKKLRELFNRAAQQWSDERPRQKFKDLTSAYPEVHAWALSRPEAQKKHAEKVIGTVAALHLESESQKAELFKASILAFEKLGLENSAKALEQFADGLFAVDLLPILVGTRSYEDALYLQILRSRIAAIERLDSLINKDELEKVLQQHLFDNMWLLDPSWEGATGDADMEISLQRIRNGSLFSKTETENQKQGRIDIQYRTSSGVHMIVELKKYGRKCKLDELQAQGEKYHEAMTEVIKKRGEVVKNVVVIFVLGQSPTLGYTGDEDEIEYIEKRLSHIGGRVLYYDELLAIAQRRYKEYRDTNETVSELDRVLASLDDKIDPSPDADPQTV